jgi:hypothetical protein
VSKRNRGKSERWCRSSAGCGVECHALVLKFSYCKSVRREVRQCDGWVCDLEAIGVPSTFKVIRGTAPFAWMLPT